MGCHVLLQVNSPLAFFNMSNLVTLFWMQGNQDPEQPSDIAGHQLVGRGTRGLGEGHTEGMGFPVLGGVVERLGFLGHPACIQDLGPPWTSWGASAWTLGLSAGLCNTEIIRISISLLGGSL